MNKRLFMLLCEALKSEHGIAIKCTADEPPIVLRQQLYKEQKLDVDFRNLKFYVSPDDPDGELWITKGKPNGSG